jgi:hypothetical protein
MMGYTELILVYLAVDMSTLIHCWLFLNLLRVNMQDQFLALATSTVLKVSIYVPNKNTEIMCRKQERQI